MELVLPAHFAHGRLDGRTLKLDHLAALLAAHVFVLRIAVVVFVEHARPDFQAAQQTGIDEFVQGAIYRCPADAETGALQIVDQLLGIEMMVLAENVTAPCRAAGP